MYVQLVKILHHRHCLSISGIECSILSALQSQSFDKTRSVVACRTMWSGDLKTCDEALEAHALAITKLARGESVRTLALTEKIETEGEEVSRLVHGTSRNIDIDQEPVYGRSHRLKISAPQNNTFGDGFCFLVGVKGPPIKGISQTWSHANRDI